MRSRAVSGAHPGAMRPTKPQGSSGYRSGRRNSQTPLLRFDQGSHWPHVSVASGFRSGSSSQARQTSGRSVSSKGAVVLTLVSAEVSPGCKEGH
jgi:hypothetical protein